MESYNPPPLIHLSLYNSYPFNSFYSYFLLSFNHDVDDHDLPTTFAY